MFMNPFSILFSKLGLADGVRAQGSMPSQQLEHIINELAVEENRTRAEIYDEIVETVLARRRQSSEQWACWQALTVREKQVTAFTCLGYTNNQIAAELYISTETVKTHIHNALSKIHLHSKEELRLTFSGWDFRSWVKTSLEHQA